MNPNLKMRSPRKKITMKNLIVMATAALALTGCQKEGSGETEPAFKTEEEFLEWLGSVRFMTDAGSNEFDGEYIIQEMRGKKRPSKSSKLITISPEIPEFTFSWPGNRVRLVRFEKDLQSGIYRVMETGKESKIIKIEKK